MRTEFECCIGSWSWLKAPVRSFCIELVAKQHNKKTIYLECSPKNTFGFPFDQRFPIAYCMCIFEDQWMKVGGSHLVIYRTDYTPYRSNISNPASNLEKFPTSLGNLWLIEGKWRYVRGESSRKISNVTLIEVRFVL